MGEKGSLKGTYFEACNCEAACQCVFLSPPDAGDCTLLVGWHIDNGTMGDVSLDALNVALAIHSPGHMAQVQWRVALYLDERASQTQGAALTKIFAGQAGGHFAVLAGHIGEVVGVKRVAIEYQAEGKRRSLRIPDIAEMEIEGMAGGGGAEVTILSLIHISEPTRPY